MDSKWTFCIFKSAAFDTNHSLWKNLWTSSRKKFCGHFHAFLVNFIGIWFDVYNFGLWSNSSDLYKEFLPIWVDLYRKSQTIFCENRLMYNYMKSLSVSININRFKVIWEKQKDFAKISQFILEIWKDFDQILLSEWFVSKTALLKMQKFIYCP